MALYGTDTYNEWYPIHLIVENPNRGEPIELQPNEYVEYCKAMNQFWYWQDRIKRELKLG